VKKEIRYGLDVVNERIGDNKLLYLVVSGSHAWGLARPDSDIDLRGVYLKPTIKVLGLHKGRDTIEFTDGDFDVQLYELEKFLNMLCKHNGNMVNLLWLSYPMLQSSLVPWGDLSKAFITKRLRYYYRGYAESQRKRAMSQRGGKALIYTYREMFSGLYVMKYEHLEHDFIKLWDTAIENGWYNGKLLKEYFPDTKKEVTDENWHDFYSEWEELSKVLDKEAKHSKLPDTFDGSEMCDGILKKVRLLNLDD